MRAGELRDRVTLQVPRYEESTQSGQGAEVFQDAVSLWASVLPVSGNESLQAGSVASLATYHVHVRVTPNVNAGMRLSWTPYRETAAKTLEILAAIQHPTMADRLVLHCGVTE